VSEGAAEWMQAPHWKMDGVETLQMYTNALESEAIKRETDVDYVHVRVEFDAILDTHVYVT